MPRTILHIDFDSFFASVEQQYAPHFRGKPIGVTATNGRTCIIAASSEAKRFGIKTGTRTFDALRLCPAVVFVPADFTKYWEVSKQFIAICKDYSPFVEVFSIDELFMDVTKTAHLFGGVERLISHIKERIRSEIGSSITVSVGISHNKLLAKLASGMRKPDGVCVISRENMTAVYKEVALTDICGIGERIKVRLWGMGIYTLLQLRQAPVEALMAEFGAVEGDFLWKIGRGIDEGIVHPYTSVDEVKSVGRNYCLPQNEYSRRRILQNIYELCEEIALKLRRLAKKARTVGISLRGSYDIRGRHTCRTPFDTGRDIFYLSLASIDQDLLSTGYARQIHIWVGNLMDTASLPLALLPEEKKQERVVRAIDALNQKYGDHTIRNGFLLYADKLTTMPNGYMADKYERQKMLSDWRLQG